MTTPEKPVLSFDVTGSNLTDPPTAICSPELVTATATNSLVQFQIVNAGYAFDPDAPIVFANPEGNFPDIWLLSDTQVAVRDRLTSSGDFSFTINLIETGTGKRFSVDPTIRNDPR
jgi:hypothetical protein